MPLRFYDVETSTSLAGSEAQVYRLYQASFNRKPDVSGLGFWIAQQRQGLAVASIAQQFLGSPEFKTLYGANVSAEAFVMAAYTNVLRRQPEVAGYAWWVAAIKGGVARADALLGFADSTENRVGLHKDMVNGFDFALPRRPGEPLVPQSSSYLNKNNVQFGQTAMPGIWDPSMSAIRSTQQLDPTLQGVNPRSLSLGDFFRDGSIAMFVSAGRYTNAYPGDNPKRWGDAPAYSYFLRMGADGQWRDDTPRLVPNPADRYTCVTPSYSLVADFNNDSVSDVMISCTGIDFPVKGSWEVEQASDQHLYLSKPDGTYLHKRLPIEKAYGHQSAAADFDRNGTVDIVIVDPINRKTPFVLWGDGHGAFTKDRTRMPLSMQGKAIFGVVTLPSNGETVLVFSGVTPNSWGVNDPGAPFFAATSFGEHALVYRNGRFEYVRDLTPAIPKGQDGRVYSLALDHVFHQGALYSLRVNFDYSAQALTRTNWSTGATDIIWSVNPLEFGNGFDQIALVNGKFMQFGANCNVYDITAKLTCAYRIEP